MDLKSIGRNIRKFRQEQNFRQEDLAERAGLSVNYVGALERGEKYPYLETFIVIANALHVTSDMLLSDVLLEGYAVKDSLLAQKLDSLSERERIKIYAVIDTLLQYIE